MNRIIYYYQTFIPLKLLLVENTVVTHIHLSSIHFGNNSIGKPYIHLNDNEPNDKCFDNMWNEINKASDLGIKIILMVGGAGSAFNVLFSDFETYYKLLKQTIDNNPCIKGIDLDVEEYVSLINIRKLISRINSDYGKDFIISMAPVAYSLENDQPGMGNFIYKDLYNTIEGKRINYFNVQFYYDCTVQAYMNIINNGYPSEKIVFGFDSDKEIEEEKKIISILSDNYEFGGVFNWEYFDSPPEGRKNPYQWALIMKKSMEKEKTFFNKLLSYVYH